MKVNHWKGKGSGQIAAELRHVALSLGVMLLMVLVVFLFNVPNPNMLLITGLAVFTSLYGYSAGVTCAAVMVLYSMYFFSTNHDFVTYTAIDLQKMGVIVLGVALNTLFIGNLKRQQSEANRKLQEINRILERDNRNLEAASLQDALTGAKNRFALRRDYERFSNRYLHVTVLDLDDFKHINDTFGHAMGDSVLKKAGGLLMEAFGADNCYRIGGDEFLVINQDLAEPDFLAKMNTLKTGMLGVRLNGRSEPIHFSAGYIYGDCELSYDLRLMMHQADVCLYEAKAMGKDCYVGRAFSRAAAGKAEEARGDEPFVF